MSARVVRLRNGEDVIADLFEVTTKEAPDDVIGFQLVNPYRVWCGEGLDIESDGEIHKLTQPEISFEPWMPLLNGRAVILKLDEVISAYETFPEVLDKYNQIVEATGGKNSATEEWKSE